MIFETFAANSDFLAVNFLLIMFESSFKEAPKEHSDEVITWLSPKLVAEIRFAEWTDENQLRQASYKGPRTDKDPKDVKRENSTEKDLAKSSKKVENLVSEKTQESKKSNKKNRKSTMGKGIRINSPDNEDYFYLDTAEGLVRSMQMGTLEFHIWGSRVEKIETPDMMVFDLDPAEGMELE